MFGRTYYHQSLRKAVAIFGTIFNDINIARRESNGDIKEQIKVPLAYGPREKYLVRINDDPDLQREVAITLPRMAFEMTSFNYDGQRKLNTIRKVIKHEGQNSVERAFNPVAYNIGIDLNIMTRYMDDANQIVEQILPFFTPSYVVTAKSLPKLGLLDDVKIQITGVNLQDNYDDDWLNRREIIYTLSFEMKVYFYGPVKEEPIINKVQVDSSVPSGDLDDPNTLNNAPRHERVTIIPDPSNSTPLDDFGFTETYETFTDVKKYNPVTGNDEDIT